MDSNNNKNNNLLILGLTAVAFFGIGYISSNILSGSKANTSAARQALDNPNAQANANTTASPIKPMDANNPSTVQVDPSLATKMEFAESAFDFGTLKEGEKVSHVFKFKNTGDKPLTISNATGSCGCTVPQYPKEAIMPNAEGEIKVEFDSKGKEGKQSKTVTITANTIPAQTVLTINSEVIKLAGKDDKKSK